jgi:hypothetical protein
MSRGFGFVENYLLGVVGKEPMTFKQILDIAFPEGTFEGDMAHTLGASSVGVTRPMRRALFRLCEKGVFQKLDIKAPHSYRLSPQYTREGPGVEFNPDSPAVPMHQGRRGRRGEQANQGANNMTATMIPFPLRRRVAFVERQADAISGMKPENAANYLAAQLKIQAEALERRGVAAERIQREITLLERAIIAASAWESVAL